MTTVVTSHHRRKFLQFLAASPVCASMTGFDPVHARGQSIALPADAIDVYDLEATAQGNVPIAHWGYLSTGVNDDATLLANRTAFEKYYVRTRRMIDVSSVDTSVELLGRKWPTPIVIAPVGSQKAFHAEGEIAVARAARSRNHLQMLSTVSSTSIEEVAAAREDPLWFQLYTQGGWRGVRARLRPCGSCRLSGGCTHC